MFDEQPLSIHIIIAVVISVVAAIWAYFRLSDSGSTTKMPVINTGDANSLGDAEIVNNQTYI